jgi:hypothetical protein
VAAAWAAWGTWITEPLASAEGKRAVRATGRRFAVQGNEWKFLLLFSKRSAFFCSFLKKRTKKLLFMSARLVRPIAQGRGTAVLEIAPITD